MVLAYNKFPMYTLTMQKDVPQRFIIYYDTFAIRIHLDFLLFLEL